MVYCMVIALARPQISPLQVVKDKGSFTCNLHLFVNIPYFQRYNGETKQTYLESEILFNIT